jgi:hypothetical protein
MVVLAVVGVVGRVVGVAGVVVGAVVGLVVGVDVGRGSAAAAAAGVGSSSGSTASGVVVVIVGAVVGPANAMDNNTQHMLSWSVVIDSRWLVCLCTAGAMRMSGHSSDRPWCSSTSSGAMSPTCLASKKRDRWQGCFHGSRLYRVDPLSKYDPAAAAILCKAVTAVSARYPQQGRSLQSSTSSRADLYKTVPQQGIPQGISTHLSQEAVTPCSW